MTDTAAGIQWGVDSALEIVAALSLVIVFVGSVLAAWRRLRDGSLLRWLGVAGLNAIACVSIYALLAPPAMLRPASDAVVLMTEGASLATPASTRAYVAPQAGDFGRGPQYLLAVGQLPLREPALGTLAIAGHGLDATQWQHLPDALAIRFEPPALGGLVAASWARRLGTGEALVVTGRYLDEPAATATVVELLDPAGVAVASHDLLTGDAFELVTRPKAAGLLEYRLQVRAGDDVLDEESVPVDVRAGSRPLIYVLQSAPSFESRQLRNWAGDSGAVVVTDTVITRGRMLRQRVNADQLSSDRLSPALLADTGLAIVDGRTWASLSSERKAWFESAVREGMGLLILADAELARYLDDDDALLQGFALAEQEREAAADVPVWAHATTQQPLPLLGLALTTRDSTPLTRLASGEVIETYRNVGLGRVAISVLRERHRWLTAGEASTYTAYWAHVMRRIARPAPLPYLLPLADDAWPRPQQRLRLCAMSTDADAAFAVTAMQDGSTLTLASAASTIGGPRRCAAFWPQRPGWHQVTLRTEAAGTPASESWFYVFADDQWREHWRYLRQQATLQRAAKVSADAGAETELVRAEIGPLWPWLAFMLAAGLLWLERRLSF